MEDTKEYTQFLLTTGELINVPIDEFDKFIIEKRDRIQPRHKKMGKRRDSPAITL